MKKNISFRNDSPNTRSPAQFWWAVPAAMAAGSAISALAQDDANEENIKAQKEINEKNIRNQWSLWRAENARQDYLNANQASIYRGSMAKAGLNLNSDLGGFSPNMATNTPPTAEAKAPTVNPLFDSTLGATMAQMVQQTPLIRAQADKTHEEAEAQRIENNRNRTEDMQYSYEDAMDYVSEHPEADLPDIEVVPKNAGWFKAHRDYNKYKGEQHQVNIYAIEDKIKNAQWANEKVRDAIIEMPWRQLNQVIELTKQAIAETAVANEQKELVKAQAAMVRLQEKLQKDNSIMTYIDKMFSDEFEFKDACKLLVLAVLGGMTRVSYSASN